MGWIDGAEELPLSRQCDLAEVSRATVYRRQGKTTQEERDEDLRLCRLIDEEYTNRPFYGSRRMAVFLRGQGCVVSRKRVQGLMREMGLAGMAPGPALRWSVKVFCFLTSSRISLSRSPSVTSRIPRPPVDSDAAHNTRLWTAA